MRPRLAYWNPTTPSPLPTASLKPYAAASSTPQIQRMTQKFISILQHLPPAVRDDVEAYEDASLDYCAGRRHSLPSPTERPADVLHTLLATRHHRRMLRSALADATRLFAKAAPMLMFCNW
jgi:hypothetical protein